MGAGRGLIPGLKPNNFELSPSCARPVHSSVNIAALVACSTVTPRTVTLRLVLKLDCIGVHIGCESKRRGVYRLTGLTFIFIKHGGACKIIGEMFVAVSLRVLFEIQMEHHNSVGLDVFNLRIERVSKFRFSVIIRVIIYIDNSVSVGLVNKKRVVDNAEVGIVTTDVNMFGVVDNTFGSLSEWTWRGRRLKSVSILFKPGY